MTSTWRCLTVFVFVCTQMVNGMEKNAMTKHHTDLTSFVTEPDIKAPLFNISHYDEGAVSPGYWFMDPYDSLVSGHQSVKAALFQVGAHIYDNRGGLVWSGASVFENRVSFDFKVVQVNGASHLSFILQTNDVDDIDKQGVGVIMDSHYRVQQRVHIRDSPMFNMHEFGVIEDGHSALAITWEPKWHSIESLDLRNHYAWVANNGFQEIDLESDEVLFDWQPLSHIDVSASMIRVSGGDHPEYPWDWLHLNSVDKDAAGDYLLSGRHTSTIYKISGRDGSIIWQLGGKNSSFVHEGGFNFSFQHDARFHEENKTHTVISFLDNASDGFKPLSTANTSSALYVALRTDVSPMTATVITKIGRPDGNQTNLRGNVQELPNDNIFVCWSENGYISEYTPSGELALEARFASDRFGVYRAYKFNFTGLPLDPPALKSYVFGTTAETITTVSYVSWNGATEVEEWRFYGTGIEESEFHLVGRAKKEGFETMYMSAGYQTLVYVEGFDARGESLGRSEVFETIAPTRWEFTGCSEGPCQIPDVATPLIGYVPDEEEHAGHSKPGHQEGGSMSTSKEGDDVHSVRNAVLILLVCGGLVVMSMLLVLQRRLRSRRSAVYKKYEKVRSAESSVDEIWPQGVVER